MSILTQLIAGVVSNAKRVKPCKYGENAWQQDARLVTFETDDPLSLGNFEVIGGVDPSYNNWCDVDRMLQAITHVAAGFERNFKHVPFIGIGVKHGNACGAAYDGENKAEVLRKMMEGDTLAIFGGLIITNFVIDESLTAVLEKKMLDGVICPGVTPAAIEKLRRKGDKCRFIVNPALAELTEASLDHEPRFRYVRGGILQQPNYTFVMDLGVNSEGNVKFPGKKIFSLLREGMDLIFAWAIGSTSNSNTITLVRDKQLIGNGVGQQDRVGAAKLALFRADRSGHATADGSVNGAVAYSDSFFPQPDGPQTLADAGVIAILTSSGSVKDAETIAVCDNHGIALAMAPDAKGRGFFGH